jgi:hypothetical protein
MTLNDDEMGVVIHFNQTAIRQQPGLISSPQNHKRRLGRHRSEVDISTDDVNADNNIRIPTWSWLSVIGDEQKQGPVYFPAKMFTSWWTAEQIIRGFEKLHERLQNKEMPKDEAIPFRTEVIGRHESLEGSTNTDDIELSEVGPREVGNGEDEIEEPGKIKIAKIVIRRVDDEPRKWDPNQPAEDNFRATPEALDRYLNIVPADITAYPEWKEIDRQQWSRFVSGHTFGLLFVWCTTGPAIYVMYMAEPVVSLLLPLQESLLRSEQGLGCLSGGILLYASVATVSWFFTTASMLQSHAAVLHYQRYHLKNPEQSLSPGAGILGHYSQPFLHSFLCGSAVITRLIGKTLAIVNAGWILAWSFLTYSNVVATPYCTTAYLMMRSHGWMRLWNFESEIFKRDAIHELGTLASASAVAFCAVVLVYFMTSDKKRGRRGWNTGLLLVGFLSVLIALSVVGGRYIRKLS